MAVDLSVFRFVLSGAALVLGAALWIQSRPTCTPTRQSRTAIQEMELDMCSYVCDPAPPRDPQARFTPYGRTGMTTAYPSEGGIVTGQLTAIELQYLNVPRFQTSFRSPDAAEEDKFSLALMQLGGHWFRDWRTFWRHRKARYESQIVYDFHYPPTVHVAYPSTGGVWLLKHSADRGSWTSEDMPGRHPSLPPEPDNLRSGRLMCLNMDDKSLVLKNLGGTFFDDMKNCTDIPTSLQAGIKIGREYDVLLQKMEDPFYLDRWHDGEPLALMTQSCP